MQIDQQTDILHKWKSTLIVQSQVQTEELCPSRIDEGQVAA
jgi:hypothetical protein